MTKDSSGKSWKKPGCGGEGNNGPLLRVHLHLQVLAKGSLQANPTPPTPTGYPQRQVSQSPGLADNSRKQPRMHPLLMVAPAHPLLRAGPAGASLRVGLIGRKQGWLGKCREAQLPALQGVLW